MPEQILKKLFRGMLYFSLGNLAIGMQTGDPDESNQQTDVFYLKSEVLQTNANRSQRSHLCAAS
jgi:hypothetical protein